MILQPGVAAVAEVIVCFVLGFFFCFVLGLFLFLFDAEIWSVLDQYQSWVSARAISSFYP